MANAQVAITTSIKLSEGVNEVASRAASGSIDLTEHTELFDQVDPSVTDKPIGLGGLAAFDFLYLETDGDISIRLGDILNTAISIKAIQSAGGVSKGVFLLETDAVDSLFVTNASASNPARVKYIFGKK